MVPIEVKLDPLSIEYSKSVIVEPPSDPAVKLTVTCPSPFSILDIVGAEGVVVANGEPTSVADAVPAPSEFTARIWIS